MAQVDCSGLNGTVKDASGKFLSGASITLVQTATGLRRETTTSLKGSYDIPELPIGVYCIIFNAPGFQEKTVEGIQQTVGHTRTLESFYLLQESHSM